MMRNTMSKIYLFGFLWFSQSVFALTPWQYLGETEHYQVSIHTQRIQQVSRENQHFLQAWSNWKTYTEQDPHGGVKGDFTMVLYRIDCQNQRIGEISRTSYAANHQEKKSKATTRVNLETITPQSIGSKIFNYACTHMTPLQSQSSPSFNIHIPATSPTERIDLTTPPSH